MALRLVLEALRFGIGPLLLCRLVRLAAVGRPAADGAADIAVVVPARDEAERIAPLLASLREQGAREIVVVDDGSTDGTRALAEGAGVRVVGAPVRPEGWNGKQWACHVGALTTTSPVLCFVDADVVLAPGALALVGSAVRERGGLVSVQPHHLTLTAAEGLSLLPNLVSMMATDGFGPARGRIAPSGAFGPVLACRRADHERVGGHEAVRAAAMEDVALAGAYRAGRLPVTLFAGGGDVTFRMHAGGLGTVIEGWTRGLGDGARHTRPLTVLLVGLWLSGLVSAPLAVLEHPLLGALLSAAWALQLWWLGRRIGRFPVSSWLLFPVGAAFFVIVFLRSAARALTGRRVAWKGRRIRA